MNSRAAANMTENFAFDVVVVRILPVTRISIGGSKKKQDLAPLF
jgi:hypothetical protein